jgi:hypothetical protein
MSLHLLKIKITPPPPSCTAQYGDSIRGAETVSTALCVLTKEKDKEKNPHQ